jgi:hypothetical protein
MRGLIGGVVAEILTEVIQYELQACRRTCTILQGVRSAQARPSDKHFKLRQRHQNQKGWQMRLAQPICFKMRQVRLAATARLFDFLRNMRNGHLRCQPGLWWWKRRRMERGLTMWAIIIWQAWIVMPVSTVNTQRYSTIHMASRLGVGRMRTARD